MPNRALLPPGAGLFIIDQLRPFQCISTAVPSKTENTFWATPTAHALVGDTAVTDSRELMSLPGWTFGVGTRFHARPFQCRAIERPFLSPPTAHALSAELAVTSLRSLPLGAAADLLQVRPFQCTIALVPGVLELLLYPSVVQMDLAETTARPLRESFSFPGFGLRTVLQARPFQCRMRDLSWKLEPASSPARRPFYWMKSNKMVL